MYKRQGLDPELLRFVHWAARHSAAMSTDTGLVYVILEASAAGDDPYGLTTPEGRRALAAHSSAVFRWAVAPPPPEPGSAMSIEEYDQIWGAAR